ncbi:MAG: hypothetical protein M1832_005218 [Thelocarpon impressellum]|nr:MAG: hypothetical protein M1832_005218 [Thelocarpon impressellum]
MEEYLCRSLGIGLIALGLMTILLTGSIPLTSSLSDTVGNGTSTEAYDPKAPYAVPSLTITTLYNSAIAFYCYARFNTVGSMAFAAAASGYGGLAAVGLWCILFASSSGRISRKTLVDKRQSSYPFANTAADKKRKGKAS